MNCALATETLFVAFVLHHCLVQIPSPRLSSSCVVHFQLSVRSQTSA